MVRAPLQPFGLAAVPALSAQGAGRGPRASGDAEQTKDAPRAANAGPSRLLHWAASATRGGESALGSFPALLNSGAPAPHPGSGGDWSGTPAMGEGGSSEDVEFSFACAARESLVSALRGLRCHSHLRDGETEGPTEPRPTPGPDTCCGPRRCDRQDGSTRDAPRAEGASFLYSGDRLTCTLYPDPAPPTHPQGRIGSDGV